MADLAETLPAIVGGGALTWVGSAILQWMKSRGDRANANAAAATTLEQHTDKFALDLLNAARGEMAVLKGEVDSLRPLQARVAHLDEALDHIEALLKSDGSEERRAAERRATAFLKRMRMLADARGAGAVLREAYRSTAEQTPPKPLRDELDKLD